MARKKVLTVTKKDCEWQVFRTSGAGGQHRDKTSSAVRCIHPPSGARGESRESRSQAANRQLAFRRMAESKEFQMWARKVASGDQALESQIEAEVERQMAPRNIKVETFTDGEWVSVGEDDAWRQDHSG